MPLSHQLSHNWTGHVLSDRHPVEFVWKTFAECLTDWAKDPGRIRATRLRNFFWYMAGVVDPEHDLWVKSLGNPTFDGLVLLMTSTIQHFPCFHDISPTINPNLASGRIIRKPLWQSQKDRATSIYHWNLEMELTTVNSISFWCPLMLLLLLELMYEIIYSLLFFGIAMSSSSNHHIIASSHHRIIASSSSSSSSKSVFFNH